MQNPSLMLDKRLIYTLYIRGKRRIQLSKKLVSYKVEQNQSEYDSNRTARNQSSIVKFRQGEETCATFIFPLTPGFQLFSFILQTRYMPLTNCLPVTLISVSKTKFTIVGLSPTRVSEGNNFRTRHMIKKYNVDNILNTTFEPLSINQ